MSCQLQGLAGLWVRLWLSWSSLSGCSWFFLLMTFTCLALKKKKNLQRGLVQWNLVFTTLEPELYSATAAKSLQSCLTLCDPIDGSPPGSAVPGILQARTLEWVAISFSNAWKWKVKVKSLSRVRLLATHGLQPTRLLHPWDFPGKSTGVGCHCLLRSCTLDGWK